VTEIGAKKVGLFFAEANANFLPFFCAPIKFRARSICSFCRFYTSLKSDWYFPCSPLPKNLTPAGGHPVGMGLSDLDRPTPAGRSTHAGRSTGGF